MFQLLYQNVDIFMIRINAELNKNKYTLHKNTNLFH